MYIIDVGTEELVDQYRIISVVGHFGYENEHVCACATLAAVATLRLTSSKGSNCLLCSLGKELSADILSWLSLTA